VAGLLLGCFFEVIRGNASVRGKRHTLGRFARHCFRHKRERLIHGDVGLHHPAAEHSPRRLLLSVFPRKSLVWGAVADLPASFNYYPFEPFPRGKMKTEILYAIEDLITKFG
jgi:hypothetical protein